MEITSQLRPTADLIEAITGRRPSPECLWRWRTRGLLLPDGKRLRLAAVRVGRTWFSDPTTVKTWIEQQTLAFAGKLRDEEAEEATSRVHQTEAELRAAGLLPSRTP